MKGFNLYIAGESTVPLLPIENPPTLQLILMYMCMCNYVSQVFYFLTNQQQQQKKNTLQKTSVLENRNWPINTMK